MATSNLPILDFVLSNYRNFNSRATRDALLAYWKHVEGGGKMFWAVAGAMSSAQLGITLAPAIREGLIHGLSVTGANLEESLFRLVAHHGYKDFPDYRYFTKHDDTKILDERMRRVTDTSIPEDEAFRAVEKFIVPMWKEATEKQGRRFWHEYFYELIQAIGTDLYEGKPEECWLLAAARAKLPIVVPGYEDSLYQVWRERRWPAGFDPKEVSPSDEAERTPPATVLGMSCSFRSRKTSTPLAPRTVATTSGP